MSDETTMPVEGEEVMPAAAPEEMEEKVEDAEAPAEEAAA